MTLEEQLIAHEGFRLKPYIDTVGKITIGVGHNLTDKGISRDVAMRIFEEDLTEAVAGAAAFPWFARLDAIRQRVVVDMVFNLGATKFRKFVGTIAAIEAGDYVKASEQMLRSRWSQQVGKRAQRLARMMRDGLDE